MICYETIKLMNFSLSSSLVLVKWCIFISILAANRSARVWVRLVWRSVCRNLCIRPRLLPPLFWNIAARPLILPCRPTSLFERLATWLSSLWLVGSLLAFTWSWSKLNYWFFDLAWPPPGTVSSNCTSSSVDPLRNCVAAYHSWDISSPGC